jgi:peptidoglycan/LPS O-acetylase OafA/YrhL
MSASRVAPLDGIRAVAVTMVVAFHFTSMTGFPLDVLGAFATPITHGWIGVDLFFGLSGFLITRLWLGEEQSAPTVNAPRRARLFYARRALRILPIYFVTLIAFLLLARLVPFASIAPFARRVSKKWTVLLPYVLFFANYVGFGRDGAFAARWSLCIEEHFYLAWPCVLLAVKTRARRLGVALGVCAFVLGERAWALAFANHQHGWGSYMKVHYATHMRIDSIMWGCAAALAYETLEREVRARRVALVVAFALVVYLIESNTMSVLTAPTPFGGSLGPSALAITAALLSVEVTAAPSMWLARALGFRPLALVGFHSYAIYLLHPLAVDVAVWIAFRKTTTPTVATWLLGVSLSVAVAFAGAFLLHLAIERPLGKVRARLHPASV